MYSILLEELDRRVRNQPDRVAWARDVCRMASYFARQGHTEAALDRIAAVRKYFDKQLEPEVACWLMLTEGILHFFQMRSSEATDCLRGAYGSAVSFGAERARPTCAAWLALIDFNENRFDSMIRFLEEALKSARIDDHFALARGSLVLADAYHFAGQYPKARYWYEQTRLSATAEGDGATLSALFHNVAAIRTTNVRLADAFGESQPEETKRAAMEACTADGYDAAIGTASFQSLVPMLQGQLLAVRKRFHEALMVLVTVDDKQLPSRLRPLVYVDQAWCALRLGLTSEIAGLTKTAADSIDDQLEQDDRAYVLARLASIYDELGIDGVGDLRREADSLLAAHREAQAQLDAKLDALVLRLGPRREIVANADQ